MLELFCYSVIIRKDNPEARWCFCSSLFTAHGRLTTELRIEMYRATDLIFVPLADWCLLAAPFKLVEPVRVFRALARSADTTLLQPKPAPLKGVGRQGDAFTSAWSGYTAPLKGYPPRDEGGDCLKQIFPVFPATI